MSRAPAAGRYRQAATGARLLDAVRDLLAEGTTYTEMSVGQIVKRANMARSTFYVYFKDKGDLLRSAFAEVSEDIEDAAQGWWSYGPATDRGSLRPVLAPVVLRYQPHAALMAAVYDAAAYDTQVRREVDRIMARSIAGLRRHILRGRRAGFIDPALPPAETAAWLVWMAERVQHEVLAWADPRELERHVDAFVDLVWFVLYAPAAG